MRWNVRACGHLTEIPLTNGKQSEDGIKFSCCIYFVPRCDCKTKRQRHVILHSEAVGGVIQPGVCSSDNEPTKQPERPLEQ